MQDTITKKKKSMTKDTMSVKKGNKNFFSFVIVSEDLNYVLQYLSM